MNRDSNAMIVVDWLTDYSLNPPNHSKTFRQKIKVFQSASNFDDGAIFYSIVVHLSTSDHFFCWWCQQRWRKRHRSTLAHTFAFIYTLGHGCVAPVCVCGHSITRTDYHSVRVRLNDTLNNLLSCLSPCSIQCLCAGSLWTLYMLCCCWSRI